MNQYRKKPVEIEAVQWDGSNWHEMLAWAKWEEGGDVWVEGNVLKIKTLEGTMDANPGDWVICGVKGELYPCKPAIFEMTYEPVA